MNKLKNRFKDYQDSIIVKDLNVKIIYVDSKKHETTREITIKKITYNYDDYDIMAFCHLRNKNRNFKLSSIKRMSTKDSDESIEDIDEFLGSIEVVKYVKNERKPEPDDENTLSLSFLDVLNFLSHEEFEKKVFESESEKKLSTIFNEESGGIEIPPKEFIFKYLNSDNDILEDDLIIDMVEMDELNIFKLKSVLTKERTLKRIRMDKINYFQEKGKSEKIEDIYLYFYELCQNSPYYYLNNIIKKELQDIDILTFIARADGKMVKEEREYIYIYLKTYNEKLDNKIFDEWLKRYKVSNTRYKISIKNFKNIKINRYNDLQKTIDKIISVDDIKDPLEEGAIKILKEYIEN